MATRTRACDHPSDSEDGEGGCEALGRHCRKRKELQYADEPRSRRKAASSATASDPSLLDAMAMEDVVNADAEAIYAEKRKRSRPRKRKTATAGTSRPSASSAGSSGKDARKPQPGDKSPWWKAGLEGLYSQAPSSNRDALPREAKLVQVDGKRQAKSWFSVKSIPLSSSADGPAAASSSSRVGRTNWRVLMDIDPLDVWSAENGAANKEATARRGKPPAAKPIKQQRCRKTCMRLSRDQKRLLRFWMGAYRLTYNRAVKLVRENPGWKDASCQYLNEQLVYETKDGHSSRVNKESTEEEKEESALKSAEMEAKRQRLGVRIGALVREHPWLEQVPSCIRKEACRDVAKAHASATELAKAAQAEGRPYKWSLKYKNRRDDSAWTIAVPTKALKQAWVEPRPETRRPRTDGQAHKEARRRNWTKVSISPTTPLGPVWLTEELPPEALLSVEKGRGRNRCTTHTIAKDCRITCDKRGRFYMSVPYAIEPTPPTAKPPAERKVGAVDPGDRVQASIYSPSDGEVVQYAEGKGGGGKDRVFSVCKKLDGVVSDAKVHKPVSQPTKKEREQLRDLVAPLKRERDRVKQDAAMSPDQRDALLKRLRKAISAMIAARWRSPTGRQLDTPSMQRERKRSAAVLRQKGRDLVTEAHRKIALDMTRRWDTLILPPFETQQMVKRKGRVGGARKLHSKVARSLMSWRHYDFKILVKQTFLRAGGEVLSPDERYTTMTCGNCGILNVKHSKETWTCSHCGTFHLRDPAASRCIFIKALGRNDDDDSMEVDQEPAAGSQPTNRGASGR